VCCGTLPDVKRWGRWQQGLQPKQSINQLQPAATPAQQGCLEMFIASQRPWLVNLEYVSLVSLRRVSGSSPRALLCLACGGAALRPATAACRQDRRRSSFVVKRLKPYNTTCTSTLLQKC
jgi:hypothetical protein